MLDEILEFLSNIPQLEIKHKYSTIDAVLVSLDEKYDAKDISSYIAAHFDGDTRIVALKISDDNHLAVSKLLSPIKNKLDKNFTIDDIKEIQDKSESNMEELLVAITSVIEKKHDVNKLEF